MNALDLPLDVTLFRSLAALNVERKRLTVNQLADLAEKTLGAAKADLPLVKLALFGERRTGKNSLRHRANMDGVSGVEGDFDAGTVTIEAAAEAMRGAGLAAVLYTSPSNTPAAPRWRVLCPLSQLASVAARRDYIGRVNAVLGGVLAGESFTDAQAFYIGGTDGAPATVIRVAGDFLDRASLPEPIYPRRQETAPIALPPMRQDQSTDEHLRQAVAAIGEAFARRGDIGRHQTILSTTNILAPFVLSGHLARTDAEQRIADAMEADGRTANGDEVSDAMDGALQKARPYCPPTGGTEFSDCPPPSLPAMPGKRLFTSQDFSLGAHTSYVVKGLIAPGNICVLLGHPGAGKSTLAPDLAYSVAQGRPFFGLRTRAGRTLIVAAEDVSGTHKRVAALGGRFGHSAECAVVEVGNLREPSARAELAAVIAEYRPVLVIIDTLAMAFAGMDENSSQDMGEAVDALIRISHSGIAVVAIHHPAKAGDTPRGHSVLNGRLDMILVLAPDDVTDAQTIVRGQLSKNRSGSTSWRLAFRKEVITLGHDAEGDAVTTTLPVRVDEAVEREAAPAKLSPQEIAAMAFARQRFDEGGYFPEDEWIAKLATLSSASKTEDRTRSARRMHAKMVAKGLIDTPAGAVRPILQQTCPGPMQGVEFA